MKIYACCGRPNACPSAELLPDGVTIQLEDDDGSFIQMTIPQWEELRKIGIKDL